MKTYDQWLEKLNRRVIFVQFELYRKNQHNIVVQAYYFGLGIRVSIIKPNYGNKPDLTTPKFTLSVFQAYRSINDRSLSNLECQLQFTSFSSVVLQINRIIKALPFKLVWNSWGRYILLDPHGSDFIGEYVKLPDAKKTCGYNFIY